MTFDQTNLSIYVCGTITSSKNNYDKYTISYTEPNNLCSLSDKRNLIDIKQINNLIKSLIKRVLNEFACYGASNTAGK